MTILDEILAEKETEVAQLKQTYQPLQTETRPTRTSLYKSFQESGRMNIIAEIKRASPSKGMINADVDPVKQAKQYEGLGAGAISVLTDGPFFKGSMEDLAAVRAAVDLPILCKDFIIDEIQIDCAKDHGADVILLIVAALSEDRLRALYNYARQQDLEVLVEVHNQDELNKAEEVKPAIIGINNRDLKTFAVELSVTKNLIAKISRSDVLIISESGFGTKADVEKVKDYGATGILVGESVMRSKNLGVTFEDLRVPL